MVGLFGKHYKQYIMLKQTQSQKHIMSLKSVNINELRIKLSLKTLLNIGS